MRVLLLLMLATFGALAAEDLRLIYFMGQQKVKVRPSGESSRTVSWDDSVRYELGAFERQAQGSVGGISLGASFAKVDGDDWKLEYETYTIRIYAGWDMPISQGFGLEIMPYTGIGMARGEMRDAGGSDSHSSFLVEYGAVADLYLALTPAFKIGAGAGYEMNWGKVKVAGGIEPNGLSYFGFMSIRF